MRWWRLVVFCLMARLSTTTSELLGHSLVERHRLFEQRMVPVHGAEAIFVWFYLRLSDTRRCGCSGGRDERKLWWLPIW